VRDECHGFELFLVCLKLFDDYTYPLLRYGIHDPRGERRSRGTSWQTSTSTNDIATIILYRRYLHLNSTCTQNIGYLHQRYAQAPSSLSINSSILPGPRVIRPKVGSQKTRFWGFCPSQISKFLSGKDLTYAQFLSFRPDLDQTSIGQNSDFFFRMSRHLKLLERVLSVLPPDFHDSPITSGECA